MNDRRDSAEFGRTGGAGWNEAKLGGASQVRHRSSDKARR